MTMQRHKLILCALGCLALTMVACPDDTATTDTGEVGLDALTDTPGGGDSISGDGTADTDTATDTDTSTTPEVVGDTTPGDATADSDAGIDIGVDVGPEPGAVGWKCSENNECDSGYCVEGYEGKECSMVCGALNCQSGFTCEQDLAVFPDVVYVCVPSFPKLCYPCNSDADCREGTEDQHTCIPTGDETLGSFCGASCAGSPCPGGWVCAVAVGVDGSSSQQCIPTPLANGDAGECTCSSGAIASGASTDCQRTVEDLGTCAGARGCTAEGLGECDALEPALDACDGVDNDCDGEIDNGQSAPCDTTNEFGTCSGMTVCDATGAIVCDALVPAAEICDGLDNDCNGVPDDTVTSGCTDFYEDGDGDGYGGGEPQCLCAATGVFTATVGGDCDDGNATISPDAAEICNEVDDNCDEVVDEENAVGCSLWNRDEDEDGFGHATETKCFCAPTGEYTAKSNTDCDDSTDTANPGAAEVCDEIDNDCDNQTDEAGAGNCTVFYVDVDADQYGDQADFACLCAAADPYLVDVGGDCDDSATGGGINPSATEMCDSVDNDCDGSTDEPGAGDCKPYYRDGDEDDYGVTADAQCLCAPSGVYTTLDGGDCNDGTGTVSPVAAEVCNGIDDDCNGTADDEGATGCADYYEDGDGDGYGVGEPQCMCGASGTLRALVPGDCKDDDDLASPGKPELCGNDDKDENCDGATDEAGGLGCAPFFVDLDGDGFGDPATETCLCIQGDHVAKGGDCDDTEATGFGINPDSTETCNAADDNCNGVIDEGCGLATTGWPTHKYGARRTGHRKDVVGPATPNLKWKVTLPATTREVETSPLILADGNIFYAYNDKAYKLAYADGAIIWETTLPAAFTNSQQSHVRASPTVREGGTIYVPTGNGMSMLGPDGALLWHTSLGPDPEDAVRGTPTIDDEGNAYFISNKFFTRMNPAGDIVWQLTIPNVQYTSGHAAWNLAGDRMYFTATNHVTYAVEKSGIVAWTFVDTGADIDGSCAVGGDGTIYSSMGDFVYQIQDTGPSALQLGVSDVGSDVDSCTSIYDDGTNEFAWVKPNGNNGAYRIGANGMTDLGRYDMSNSGAPGSAPVFDASGTMYIGGGDSKFHAANQDTSDRWTFDLDNTEVDGSAAIGDGFIVFADDNGVVYLLE